MSVCVFMCVYERERERERDTYAHTYTHMYTEILLFPTVDVSNCFHVIFQSVMMVIRIKKTVLTQWLVALQWEQLKLDQQKEP